MNTSFLLIKPSVCTEKVLELARDHFDIHGVRVEDMQLLTGQQVSRGAYVERHFSAASARAMSPSTAVAALESEESAMLFYSTFGESWDAAVEDRRVLTPEDAMIVTGTTVEGLNERWWNSKLRVRLEHGFYVSYFEEEKLYVINGHYPLLLHSLTATESQICFFILSWPETRYTWKQFCLEVIGAADPREAVPTSFRGVLYEGWEAYGLSKQPSIADNGTIYANGPIESLAFRFIWLHRRVNEDDFGRLLLQEGLSRSFVENVVKNIPITYGEVRRSVFEMTEDMQSSEAVRFLVAVYKEDKMRMNKQNSATHGTGAPSCLADWTIVLDDEDSCEVRNRALLFVKPHANTAETRSLVEERLMQVCGMQVISQHHVSGSEVAAKCLMKQHYGTIARYAVTCTPESIQLTTETEQEFQKRFGRCWGDVLQGGRVWNADTAMRILGDISSTELYELWCSCTETMKLTPGAYVARLSRENAFLINGFFPYLQDSYEREDANVTCYVVSWLESRMTWRSFREDVVGCTNPERAHPNSLRGLIRDHWHTLGLKGPCTTTDNGVHASAGPLEAVLERHLWVNSPLTHDPFTLRLEERGLTGALLYGWRTNPVVVMGDGSRRGCVFDLLENLQTTEVVDLMCDAEQKLLAGYNEKLVNRAVVVLKPYAVSNSTITTIRDFLASSDVKVLQEVMLPSVCVKERFLGNSSFLKLSRWADFTSEELLSDLVSIVKDNFSAYFELGWDDCVSRGRLMGATDICKRFSLTAAELLSQWEAAEQMELHSTCWVAHLTTHNVYVLNGFVPFVRETYSKPGSVTRVFEVEWREDAWTWKDFCERLIGYTETSNPQTAAEGSLQRVFVNEWKNLGLPFRPDTPWSAALYVSQGPLEGVADRGIWLGVDIPGDHFVQRLLLEGVPLSMLSPYLYDNCDLWSGGGGELEGTRSLKDDASRSTQTESMGKSLSASGYFVPQYTRHDLSYHEQSTEVVRRLKVISSRFLCGLKMNYAFLWVKPHACSKEVEAWVPRALAEHRVEVISSGCMLMHDVFRKELADRKQCALYRNAMTREAHEIPITTKQMVEFELAFGMTWGTALSLHLVVNAARAVERMGALDLLKEWDGAPRKVCLSPALYIAFIEKEGLYVVNGFYPYLRSRMYTGSHVFWYVVSWDSEVLTWEEFHRHVIGGDVPDKAEKSSLRHTLYNSWEELGLLRPPDGIDNGFCASSTPIEGISDRVAWLGIDVQQDVFGRLLLMSGIPAGYLRQMLDNPCVRHRDEPLEAAGDAFDKLCTENPLLIAQLIALHSSGGMRVVSSPTKNITTFTPSTPVAHASEDVVRCNNNDAVEHLVEQAEASKSGVALPPSCVEGGVRRNYAFIMINPACTSPVVDDRVLSYITDFLRHKNIRVDGRGCVCAEDPELCHVIHTLEHGVFKYAVRQSPYQYALTSEALLSFLDAFQQVWDPRKVYNAMDASVEFNYSASYLKDRWLTCDPLVRIAPCCYVGKMPGEDIYIVNGFALHSAKTFCAAPNVKYFFLVSWDNDDGDYAHFLDSVIGDPYVKEAKHGSLQQVLCDEWEVAGLTCPPDQFEGAVLASASPLEAMLLKQMCFSLDIKRDAVCRFAMDELSVTPYIMRRCLTNPRRPCGDGRFMFDVARGMNSTDVLQLIRRENVDYLGEAPRNSAFVLLKSHSLCRGFSLTVETVFARAKIRIDEEGDISAATLRSRDFMRHLYPVETAYAERDVESIKLTLSERERVRQVFGVSWVELLEGGVLVNAVHALKSLVGVTPIQLFYKCMAAPRKVTIRPGVVLHELHCDGIFVVNGFVPGLKVFLESTNAMQHWYVVSWSPNEMNWPTFLQEVIGDDSPKDAAVTSVRGQLYRRWRDYGITEPPDELRNGLHVSQGALQAIRQRTKCLSHSIQEDYLGSVLLRSGVHESVLHTWLENPEVTSNGIKISIFEHLGHSDTPRLLQILSALTEELRRATEKDPLAAARLPAIATESHPQEGNLGSNVTSQRPVRENAVGAAAAQPLGSPLLVESGSLLLYKNTAMVIVKPHVSDNVKVLGLLEEILDEHKIQIKRHLYKKVTLQIVEQHFSSPMLYATALVNGRLDVTPSGKEGFYNTFGEEWESVVSSGRVAGACEVLSQLSITPSQLYVKWTLAQEHVQLAYDMEVTKFHAEDVYVVNAITPFECASMIQGEADACSVHCYVVSWDQRECSWKRFLDDVIGEPDPASACPTSFRGRLFAEWSAYDLPVKPNRIDNIVLASEGPLQAYKERELWCGKCDLAPDPLIRALCHVDHDLADLPEWVENPLVRYTGSRRNELNDGFYTGHLFGFVRALDTQQFIEVMTEREGVFLPLVLEQVGAGGSCNGCVDGGKQCSNAVAQADYLCESQDFLNVLADNSDNMKMLEWLRECLLEGSDDSLLLLWNHYGGRVVGEREAQKSGCVGSLLSRVVASHKDGDGDARETLCGTIDGESFRRDVEALEFFGQPLSKGNRSRMFERMRQRGNGRMTLEEFRMALAVLRQM